MTQHTPGHGINPQSLVEHALAASMADDCVAIVRDATSANRRWANNTLTTNGVMHGVHVSIVSFVKQSGGVSVGSCSGSATTQAEVVAWIDAPLVVPRAFTAPSGPPGPRPPAPPTPPDSGGGGRKFGRCSPRSSSPPGSCPCPAT